MPYKNPTLEQRKKMREWSRAWAQRNHHRRSRKVNPAARQQEYEQNRLRKFGITRVQLVALWEQQSGLCAICPTIFEKPFDGYIDHDHTTGQVRGLLCNGCNTGLGMFRESTANLAAAISYIERYR